MANLYLVSFNDGNYEAYAVADTFPGAAQAVLDETEVEITDIAVDLIEENVAMEK